MAKSKWPQVKDKLVLIEKWCRDGLTEEQICKNIGVGHSAFNEYKHKYPELTEALKAGKEIFIAEVENALAKKAKGFIMRKRKPISSLKMVRMCIIKKSQRSISRLMLQRAAYY